SVLRVLDFEEPFPDFDQSDEWGVRDWCRMEAEQRDAGLIQARRSSDGLDFIYKRLVPPAYVYTGMLIARVSGAWLIWTMVSGEVGITGIREAVVTTTLFNEKKLTLQEYQERFAQDPYDPNYATIDRRVLRFLSDDACYDEQFPDHPLSLVRRTLAALP